MAKIKLTKGELKRQRDSLKQFRHYLPTLLLKKQQLQMKILETRREQKNRQRIYMERLVNIERWANLLADPEIDIREWVMPVKIETDVINIAGASVPVFKSVSFKPVAYDFYVTPFWIDSGIEQLRVLVSLIAEVEVIKKQIAILEKELRITTQRVNLFEKIKIPECLENIRMISIYLGDQMANAVGIGKVAKKKIESRNLEAVPV